MEETSGAELITSPRISFSHDLAPTFEPATAPTSLTIMSPRRRPRRGRSRRGTMIPAADEPEFDFANEAAADVAPAGRLFSGGKLLPVPPLPPVPPVARPPPWPEKTTSGPPPPRPKSSPFARSSSVNSTAAESGRFTCPAFPLMRSRSAGAGASAAVGGGRPPHSKKVAPAATAGKNGGGGGGRSGYYYGYGGGRINGGAGSRGSGVRVSPVLNVTSIGTSVVNLLSYLLCDCGEKGAGKSRDLGLNCWVTR